MLRKQIKEYGKVNQLAAKSFQEMLEKTIAEYHERRKHLTAEEAGITVKIDYYAQSFSNKEDAKGYTAILSTDSSTEIHTFIIHLENNKNYNGPSPVKSMDISSYYTHVDTTDVPAGEGFYIYNNDAKYYYRKNKVQTGLTKGVSTSNYSHSYFNKDGNPYKPTATGDYKSGMDVYYELVLDVSSYKKFSKDKDGNYTVTVISGSMIRIILKSNALVRPLLLSSKTSTTGESNMSLIRLKAKD